MKYTENGKTYDIENQELKGYLTDFYHSIENLSKMISNSNIIGTYSEILVCSVLGLEKEKGSHSGTDAKGPDGATYQIKSRWNKKCFKGKSGQNEFGSVKYCKDKYPFSFLILVYYEYNLLVPKVFKIKSSDINSLVGKGAQIKETRLIFKYNTLFKKAVKENLYICDISDQFENIFI